MKIFKSNVEIKIEHPICLVTGDGRTLPDDVARFLSWKIPHDVIAVGRSITHYPGKVLHWAIVDGYESIWWADHLPLKNDGKMPIRHTLGEMRGFDVDWDDELEKDSTVFQGTSSLFAVQIALAMGYEKVVMAGCPLDAKGHWYFDEGIVNKPWLGENYTAWMDFARTEEGKRVKSLSGYSAQIIGEASKEWVSA